MRRLLLSALLACSLLASEADAVAVAPRPGTVCKPAGKTVVVAAKKYTCVRVKGKLVWSKAISVAPRPTPTPTETPTPEPLPTPLSTIAPASMPTAPQNIPSSRYAFQAVDSRGVPVHWDRCRPITWTYFPEASKPYALGVVQTALQSLANATGFTFRYVDPAGAAKPTWSTIGNPDAAIAPAQLQIMFGDASNIPELTGNSWGNTALYRDSDTYIAQVAYVVVRADIKYGSDNFGALGMGLVFMHELAHAVGLDHVASTQDLMYPNLAEVNLRGYAAGDLAGLYKVSAAIPCGV